MHAFLSRIDRFFPVRYLMHPNQFRATHLVRRTAENEVRLLGTLLPQVRRGQLLEVAGGCGEWPHRVYRYYWPLANANTFVPNDLEVMSRTVDVERVIHESAA